MVVEYIRYRIPDEQRAEFEDAYARAGAVLAASPQCIDYELARCDEEPGSYILRISWTSRQGHLEGFRSGPTFGAFFAEIRPYVPAIEEMRHYERTAVAGAGAAAESGMAQAQAQRQPQPEAQAQAAEPAH